MEKRPTDVNPAMKELYLEDVAFEQLFGMSHLQFLGLPKWKRDTMKREKGLF